MVRSDSKDRSEVRSHPRQQMRRPALREIPRTRLLIPHPCEEGMPEGWIFYLHPSSEAAGGARFLQWSSIELVSAGG